MAGRRRCCGARAGPASPLPCAPSRRRRPNPARPRASGWPMTSCWPGRSRSAWCAGGRASGRAGRWPATGTLRGQALAAFGFPPTEAQRQALAEIDADLAAPRRMLRLLQGDVGSGKTLVAVMAMLRAVEAGAQAALMAPTELLARQHLRTLREAVRRGRGAGRAADRQREGRASASACWPGWRMARIPLVRRHPCAVPGRRRLPRPGAGGGGRTAPLRRRPAPDAGREGRAPWTCW